MWPVIMAALRNYAPMVVFPAACLIGVIGYNLERTLTDRSTPWSKSVIERREERKMNEKPEDEYRVPATIFERNKKPSS